MKSVQPTGRFAINLTAIHTLIIRKVSIPQKVTGWKSHHKMVDFQKQGVHNTTTGRNIYY